MPPLPDELPWSVHVHLRTPHRHLGEVLDPLLPQRAALLAEEQATVAVVPASDDESVLWGLAGPMVSPELLKDADSSPLADQVRAAVGEHGAVVTLAPLRSGDGAQVSAVIAMLFMLMEQGDVAAIWWPHQRHVTTAEQLTADIDAEMRLTFRVHPTAAPDGTRAVITRGLAAIGGREVLLSDAEMDQEELAKRLRRSLDRIPGPSDVAPVAGQETKFGFTRYELHEDTDPMTHEPVLRMVEGARKRGLFRRRG